MSHGSNVAVVRLPSKLLPVKGMVGLCRRTSGRSPVFREQGTILDLDGRTRMSMHLRFAPRAHANSIGGCLSRSAINGHRKHFGRPRGARQTGDAPGPRDYQLTRLPRVSSATFLICATAAFAPAVLVSRSNVASSSSPTGASA